MDLYFECGSGISGDMTVAALLDLGADKDVLLQGLESLHVDGFHVHISKVKKCGIEATDFDVHLAEHTHDAAHGEHVHSHEEHSHSHEAEHIHADGHTNEHAHTEEHGHHHPHEHRNLHSIVHIIEESGLSARAKELAVRMFEIVAEAESKAHGLPVAEVHFHEVGAVDSIVDIVGAAICLDNLGVERVYCVGVSEGQGTVRCQHGVMPVPVPAVANIAAAHGLPLRITNNNGEMVTPTGAAILAGICTDSKLPESFRIVKTGIGAGKKDFAQANILRVLAVEPESKSSTEEVVVLQSNIDDQSPETLAYAMEKLLQAGARDVWLEPIVMKKNRSAVMLNVLCTEEQVNAMSTLMFKETTSIGIRYQSYKRIVMEREAGEVQTCYGLVQVKRCRYGEIHKNTVEFESAKQIAEQKEIPLEEVYRATFEQLK